MNPTVSSLSIALLCILSFGCAGKQMVPVSDVHTVVGRWDGVVEKRPLLARRGPVSLTIREDSVYIYVGVDFWDDRLISGTGQLAIRDGRLYMEEDERHAVLTLHKRGDEEVLIVEATNAAGKKFHVDLSRSLSPPLP